MQFLEQFDPQAFTSLTVATFDDHPDPILGDMYRYPHGRVELKFPDGSTPDIDVGNVRHFNSVLTLYFSLYLSTSAHINPNDSFSFLAAC